MVAQPMDIIISREQHLGTETRHQADLRYLNYFDHNLAMQQVKEYLNRLGSSQRKSRHTERAYMHALTYYFQWSQLTLPTANLIESYIAHLVERDLKHSTINNKYLAPLRLYLGKLAGNPIDANRKVAPPDVGEDVTKEQVLHLMTMRQIHVMDTRNYIDDCRHHIEAAKAVKNAKARQTTNLGPLWHHGTRLTRDQMNALLRQIPRDTVMGLRNYAFMRLAFESAFRVAEMQAITLDSIKPHDEYYLVTVLGKRNNIDPVGVSSVAIDAIHKYIKAFNDQLAADDPRRITNSVPIWQPLTRSSNPVEDADPAAGMSKNALSHIVKKTSERVLGKGKGMAAHDTRRTFAAIAYNSGMDVPNISVKMRHKEVSTTWTYIGKPPDFSNNLLTKYVNIE